MTDSHPTSGAMAGLVVGLVAHPLCWFLFLLFQVARDSTLRGQGHRIKIGGLGRMANLAFGGKLNLCGTYSHLFTMFVVYLVVDNKYNVYVR